MLARTETIIKWLLYTAAALACFVIQGTVLQRISIWGVIPFVYPAVAAIPATYEGTVPGTAFAVGVGVACDLLLPASSPCFYTLVFPLVGLCAALLSESVCRAGFLCSLLSTAAAFCITGLAHALVLWAGSKAAWGTAASVAGRELCLTLPFIFPMTVLFRAVYWRAHRND